MLWPWKMWDSLSLCMFELSNTQTIGCVEASVESLLDQLWVFQLIS